MARPVHRVYATCGTLLALGAAMAGIAGQTSGAVTSADDPRLAVLAKREAFIEKKAKRAAAIVERRWDVYRAGLKRNKMQAAQAQATPAVRYVTLPPVTVSRSS
jgi:hypothetical protein